MIQHTIKRDDRDPKRVKSLCNVSFSNFFACITFIGFICITLSGCDTSATAILSSSSPSLQLTMEAKKDSARLTKIGWDTEGTGRDTINLLKSPVELLLTKGNQIITPYVAFKMPDNQTIRYRFS